MRPGELGSAGDLAGGINCAGRLPAHLPPGWLRSKTDDRNDDLVDLNGLPVGRNDFHVDLNGLSVDLNGFPVDLNNISVDLNDDDR